MSLDRYPTGERWTAIVRPATVVAVGLVLGVAGFGIGRGTAPSLTTPGAQRSSPSGPTRAGSEVGTGHAQTPQGAVAAATDDAMLLGGALLLHPDQLRSAEQMIAMPEAARQLGDATDATLTVLDRRYSLNRIVGERQAVAIRYVPAAYRLDAYAESSARVSIWGVWLLEADTKPLAVNWTTASYSLQWAGMDWRVTGTMATADPAPTSMGQPDNQGGLMPAALRGYTSYRYATS